MAELARIVGYEERVVAAKPDPLVAPAARAERREPAFNLEDELLREFERYDAPSPSLDPADDLGVAEPRQPEVSSLRQVAPLEPVFDEPPFSGDHDDLSHAFPDSRSTAAPVSAQWADDTGLRHAVEAFEAEPSDVAYDDGFDPVVVEEVVADVAADLPQPEVSVAPADLTDRQVAPHEAAAADATSEFDTFDLTAELETSISAAPAVTPVAEIRRKPGYTPSFRMPLANFQSSAGVDSLQRVEPKISAEAPRVEQPAAGWNVSAPSEPLVAPMDIPLAGPVEPVSAKPAQVSDAAGRRDEFSELDELLYDVDRYSSASRAQAAPVEPVREDQAPVSVVAPLSPSEPVAAAPLVGMSAKPAPVTAPSYQAPVSQAPSSDEATDPFADLEFELALDDLELDLADMVVSDNIKDTAPAREEIRPQAAPAMAPVAPPTFATPPAAVVASAAVAAPSYVAAPAQPRFEAVAPNAEPEDDVAFDPALIAEADEQPEAIAELDVPTLPVEEKEEPPLYRSDFDLDIDAELASLLESPEPVASAQHEPVAPAAVAMASAAAPAAAKQSVYADLDDFERALEEDFRRSLATPLAADDRYAATEGYEQNIEAAQRRPSIGRWIAPLAAVGVIAVFGAGAYAWLGGSTSGASGNGEPVVIAADTDPVKVAPENPGGKTVPNQDKAVYDRVAGGASDAPKQQQLISSSEEPVDVVQKTLMPESLPLEGENDVQMTDVSDTDDPRLLPQDQQAAPQAPEQQAVAVMPRKVKTMIVRADGKLVEQEIEQPAPAAAAEKIAAAPARADVPSAQAQSAAPFPTAGQAPVSSPASAGVVPVSAPVSQTAAPADMASAASAMPAAAQVPAAIEQLAEPAQTATVRAPVPAMRPAQQPVNVVAAVSDQGNVRPTAAAPAAQNAAPANQVASLGDGGYVIQIASLPSQADAQKSYQNLSGKFGSVIGGRGVDIKAAEIAGKGTFYRVRIPAGSKTEAVALCERYRAAGGSCLVAR